MIALPDIFYRRTAIKNPPAVLPAPLAGISLIKLESDFKNTT
jgi:hypothetical protein